MENERYFVFSIFRGTAKGIAMNRATITTRGLYPTEKEQKVEVKEIMRKDFGLDIGFDDFHVTHPIELTKDDFERALYNK